MEDYYSGKNVRARVRALVEQADRKNKERHEQVEKEYFEWLMLLIGHTIVAVRRDVSDETTYTLILDDGTQITAIDGEYGSDAFVIIRKDE